MKSETTSVLVGIAAGLAIGAALGMLFAPDKGSETRRRISRRSKDQLDDWSEQLADIKEKYNHSLDLISDKLQEIEHESAKNRP